MGLEILIGIGGFAAGWMLLKKNLLEELIQKAEPISAGIGALLGIVTAVLIWLVIKLVRPLQQSRSLEVLVIVKKATWLQILLICAIAGITEEILFRGALQPSIGIWPAAVLFGLLHAYGRLYVFVAIFAGACLGYMYWYTDSLAVVAAAHIFYNITISVLVKFGLFPLAPGRLEESVSAGTTIN